jgi:uncharacterized DUF497 family protein
VKFGWNAVKAASNLRKHRVSFDEGKTVFQKRMYLQDYDTDHSSLEDRWTTIGVSKKSRLLVVVTTERHGNVIWIISARKATRIEAQRYEEEIQNRIGDRP